MLQFETTSETIHPLLCRRLISIALLFGLVAIVEAPSRAFAEPEADDRAPIVLAGETQLLGHWQRGKGEAIIEISERGGVYSGVIVWSQKRPETVGIEVFRELRYDAEDEEWHGRAYSIKRKREVPIDVRLLEHDQLELTAHILIEFSRVPSSKVASLRAKRGL
jgi:uncharacterized protein (DUF2147 family)